jgi:hypothetical protein
MLEILIANASIAGHATRGRLDDQERPDPCILAQLLSIVALTRQKSSLFSGISYLLTERTVYKLSSGVVLNNHQIT